MKKTLIITLLLILCFSSTTVFATPVDVSTYAGNHVLGDKDGHRLAAQFRLPTYAAVEESGVIYVSDTENHLIRKIENESVTVIAGFSNEKDKYGQPIGGFKNGNKAEAMFNQPRGLAVAADDTIYVADTGNGAIRSIKSSGEVTTIIEGLDYPSDIVIDSSGSLLVTETLKHRIIKVSLDGQMSLLAGGGYSVEGDWLLGGYRDGQGENAQFNEPTGMALGSDGILYVSDTGNQRIRAVSQDGIVKTIAGTATEKIEGTDYFVGGYKDGDAVDAQFNFPTGIVVGSNGSIYVADMLNHRIREITIDDQVLTIAGTNQYGHVNGHEGKASFDHPSDLVQLKDQSLLIVDRWNHSLRQLKRYSLPNELLIDETLQIVYNDEILEFDVQPLIKSRRTMIPIRKIVEELGYEVEWLQIDQSVLVSKGDREIRLQVASKQISGDVELEMDISPFIENSRMFIPLRFVAEVFGAQVNWLGDSKTVLIRD